MKVILRTVTVVLLIAAIAAIGWFSQGYRDWNVDNWKQSWKEAMDKVENGKVTDGDGNELDQNAVNKMPEEMTFQAALNTASASMSVTIVATVKPDTAVDKTVDWTISWVNAESEWASGKTVTDYVTVTPQSDGSTTATVNCLQPFGEKIVIVATSRSNPDAYASVSVDYAKRIESAKATISSNITLNEKGEMSLANFRTEETIDPSKTTPQVNNVYSYGVGTTDAVSVGSVQYFIKASAELHAAKSTAVESYVEITSFNQELLFNAIFATDLYKYHGKTDPIKGEGGIVIPGKPAGYTLQSTQWNSIVSALNGLSGHAFELKIVVNTEVGAVESVVNITINKSSLEALAETVSIEKDEIVF